MSESKPEKTQEKPSWHWMEFQFSPTEKLFEEKHEEAIFHFELDYLEK